MFWTSSVDDGGGGGDGGEWAEWSARRERAGWGRSTPTGVPMLVSIDGEKQLKWMSAGGDVGGRSERLGAERRRQGGLPEIDRAVERETQDHEMAAPNRTAVALATRGGRQRGDAGREPEAGHGETVKQRVTQTGPHTLGSPRSAADGCLQETCEAAQSREKTKRREERFEAGCCGALPPLTACCLERCRS